MRKHNCKYLEFIAFHTNPPQAPDNSRIMGKRNFCFHHVFTYFVFSKYRLCSKISRIIPNLDKSKAILHVINSQNSTRHLC